MRPSHLLLLLITAEVVVGQLGGAAEGAGDTHLGDSSPPSWDATTQSRGPRRVTTADPVTVSGVDTVSSLLPSTPESSASSVRVTSLSTAPHIPASPETLARSVGPEASSTMTSSTTSILFIPDVGDREASSRDLTSHGTLGPPSTALDQRQPTVARGDLPPQLDSEETIENVTGLLFTPPEDLAEGPSGQPLDGFLFTPPQELTHGPGDHPLENVTGASETNYKGVGSSGAATGNTRTPGDFSFVLDNTSESDGTTSFQEVTVVANPVSKVEETTTTDLDYLFEEGHIEAAPDTRTTLASEVTPFSPPSHLELYDKWTWFYVVLRGNCLLVNLNDSSVLFSDFTTSFSRLVLYDEEHVAIQSMTCSGQKMTVNMTIDSFLYPECEGDLQTLRAHRNLRIHLHNTSFYVESYETKRTLIFETKPDIEEDNSAILYLTLGGVGISLMCIVFAGILFAIYQYCVLRKAKLVFARTGDMYLPDSPRSLRPKKEKDQGVRFSKTHTYSVNMYRSYNDLSSGDLYTHLHPQESGNLYTTHLHPQDSGNLYTTHLHPQESGGLYTTPIHPRNSSGTTGNNTKASANSKTPKKTKRSDGDGSFPSHHQELWTENFTQSTEEFMAIMNGQDDRMSSFKRAIQGPGKESLHPLLLNGRPNSRPDKTTESPDDPPTPPTCPSSPSITKGVLKRMDDLISNAFSNSSPNISTNGTYITAYSDTMMNVPSSPTFTTTSNTTTTTSHTNSESPRGTNVSNTTSASNTSSSGAGKKAARVPTASNENLCLTRITFMGTENPSFRMETDM